MDIIAGIRHKKDIFLNKLAFKKQGAVCKNFNGFYGKILVKKSADGEITLGEKVKINSGKTFNPIGFNEQTIFWSVKGGKIKIGNNVGISNSAFVSMESITVEDDVLIGGGCKIYDTDFHSVSYEQRIMVPETGAKTKPVLIKKGAFIGAGSIILKGVTVGEKAVVGAGSVVTKDVPDGEIWAGNPAKKIR